MTYEIINLCMKMMKLRRKPGIDSISQINVNVFIFFIKKKMSQFKSYLKLYSYFLLFIKLRKFNFQIKITEFFHKN